MEEHYSFSALWCECNAWVDTVVYLYTLYNITRWNRDLQFQTHVKQAQRFTLCHETFKSMLTLARRLHSSADSLMEQKRFILHANAQTQFCWCWFAPPRCCGMSLQTRWPYGIEWTESAVAVVFRFVSLYVRQGTRLTMFAIDSRLCGVCRLAPHRFASIFVYVVVLVTSRHRPSGNKSRRAPVFMVAYRAVLYHWCFGVIVRIVCAPHAT